MKRFISFMLAAIMLAGMLSFSVFARAEHCDYCPTGIVRKTSTSSSSWQRPGTNEPCDHGGGLFHNDVYEYREVTEYYSCDNKNCGILAHTITYMEGRWICGYTGKTYYN